MMKRTLIGFLVLLPAVLYGQYNRPGSTDAQFLKIGVSARGTGMADAYMASVNGADATFYNSAALRGCRGVMWCSPTPHGSQGSIMISCGITEPGRYRRLRRVGYRSCDR